MKNLFNKSCSTTSKNPYQVQSDLSYNLRVESQADEVTAAYTVHAQSAQEPVKQVFLVLEKLNNCQNGTSELTHEI